MTALLRRHGGLSFYVHKTNMLKFDWRSVVLCFVRSTIMLLLTLLPGLFGKFTSLAYGEGGAAGAANGISVVKPADVYARFNTFNNLVRDCKIKPEPALKMMNMLLDEIGQDYYRRGGRDYSRNDWVFPLEGHGVRSITGGRNKGYVASGYKYFSGNRHGGHPSFDIFIRDRNQDCLDDRTARPVRVLSLGGGVVVALEKTWARGSRLRGGKYLWIYDPLNKLLVYYAHNSELLVDLGTIVRPGDVLANVGRSGLNADKRRSPTHLHLTVIGMQSGSPKPVNVYSELVRARQVRADH